ncbi:hypothetical protein F442_10739 [Phytophthora nicotianae P10297]|uniref:Temptin Cys/Cys disulfide domain-containing protein n=1 Tax=Phytophthora nicotianae P10297 TaxID=1317064 RepID=W2Z806_PHYNI|nr:hypothetical protein F442_10739 [Phytophthora nicotianae P10297]
MQAFIGKFLAFAAFAAPQASSYSMYAMRVPNGDKVPGVTALGHLDPVLAGPMNEFGMDMIDADFHWTKKFCMKDSDGDGQTNGQELGDPCCEFVFRKNPKVRWTEGISHPGDATYMSDPKLWEGLECEESADTAARPANASGEAGKETKTDGTAVMIHESASNTTVQAEKLTEDAEQPLKVSSQKTVGGNETAVDQEVVVQNKTAGASSALFSSSLLSAAAVLGLLAFVMVRMRRRRSQWTLLPQQGRRAQ